MKWNSGKYWKDVFHFFFVFDSALRVRVALGGLRTFDSGICWNLLIINQSSLFQALSDDPSDLLWRYRGDDVFHQDLLVDVWKDDSFQILTDWERGRRGERCVGEDDARWTLHFLWVNSHKFMQLSNRLWENHLFTSISTLMQILTDVSTPFHLDKSKKIN